MMRSVSAGRALSLLVALGAHGCAVDPTVDAANSAVAHSDHRDDVDIYGGTTTTASMFEHGPLDPGQPFSTSLGSNDRACVTCHQQAESFSISPATVQARFERTSGLDPIFRLNDGANAPTADVSTVEARRAAYSMLLSRGLIRIGLPIPAGAEFTLIEVDDPYGFASAGELSLFRRPLPSTNLRFLTTVMWDGREPDLGTQAIHATLRHAEAAETVQAQMDQIVDFETGVFTAASSDSVAGDLGSHGGRGGPALLVKAPFFLGINDPLGGDPTGAAFDPRVFTLYDSFAAPARPGKKLDDQRRYSIFRGQEIFNTRPIAITGVVGLNDALGAPTIDGTCTTCHDTPNVGNHSLPLPLNLGLTDEDRRTPDMPLYTLQNNADGEIIKTTDPGRALVTGRWKDIGKFKGPILRGLTGRAPYFHNGFAATLDDVVDFYDTRFGLGLTDPEKRDLVAFLQAL